MPDPATIPGGAGGPPGGATPPGGASAGAPPQGGGGTGTSPATMPVANRGAQAAAKARLGNIIQMLHMIAGVIGPGDEASAEINKAISGLSKIVPPGSQSEGLMRADLAKMQAMQRQNQMNALQMRSQGGAGGGAPPPGAPPPMPQAA